MRGLAKIFVDITPILRWQPDPLMGMGAIRFAHHAWQMAGATLVLLIVIEALCRLVGAQPAPTMPDDGLRPHHPYANEAWYAPWLSVRRQQLSGPRLKYDPYRGWWPRPVKEMGLNVDADGYRKTIQPAFGDDRTRQPIFMFGGSTMWGYTVRDKATIPSIVAEQLFESGIVDFEVRNMAQSGFNLAQGMASLNQELVRGARPAAVVFLDGVNELGPIAGGGRPGEIYEQSRAQDNFGRAHESTARTILRVIERMRFVRICRSLRERPRVSEVKDIDVVCDEVAESYINQIRIGEALAREFDFKIFFFWQPTLAMSQKRLGPWEAQLMSEQGTKGASLVNLLQNCTANVDERLLHRTGDTYFPMHDVFDDCTEDQFIDHFGHVTETANELIARRITRELRLALGDRPADVRGESR